MQRTKDSYTKKELEQHIRDVPDSYIGSDQKVDRTYTMFDNSGMVQKEHDLPEGVERCYLEILTNALDNIQHTRELKRKEGSISIDMDESRITVRNEGEPFVLDFKESEKLYIPELVFGELLSGSSYGDTRTTGGRNGYGAKLTNIFSTSFSIDLYNARDKKRYQQSWSGGLAKKSKPIITPLKELPSDFKDSSYTQVSYVLDFERFGMDKYVDNDFFIFARHAIDLSFAYSIPISFNGNVFDLGEQDYIELYSDADYIFHENERMKVFILDTPEKKISVSYANSINNLEGGVHLDAATDVATSYILSLLKKSERINAVDVKQRISVFVYMKVTNAKFHGQAKLKLTSCDEINRSGKSKYVEIPPNILKSIDKWQLMNDLKKLNEYKDSTLLSKLDGKKTKKIDISKGIDALYAGTSKSADCILIITEGKSADSYAQKAVSKMGGSNVVGTYPLQGKLLNVLKAKNEKIINNNEIMDLSKLLGLKSGLDYTKAENQKTLRYRKVVVVTDADHDGLHITGLTLCLFSNYESLIKIGMISMFRTPVIRIKKDKFYKAFITLGEFSEWISKPENFKYKPYVKYCKGLASSRDSDIDLDFKDPKYNIFTLSDNCRDIINKVFKDKDSLWRKDWIKDTTIVTYANADTVLAGDYIKNEMVAYSKVDVERSLPGILDGLKLSQRKMIWAAIAVWGKKSSGFNILPNAKSMKTSMLANEAVRETNYHYGVKSLEDAAALMAQYHTCSNNLPWFEADGQFGSRKGTDPGSSRYTHLLPAWWLPYVIKAEDMKLLKQLEEDGHIIEPETLLPPVPTVLFNGLRGIGTGSSTEIPSYNILDSCKYLVTKIKNKDGKNRPYPILVPWYRGFTGKIVLNAKGDKYSSEGVYSVTKDVIRVTEIPISLSLDKYAEKLEEMEKEKLIKKFVSKLDEDTPDYTIHGFVGEPSLKSLKLISNHSLNNIVLLDENNKPQRYASAEAVIDKFFTLRAPYYDRRRTEMLKELKANSIFSFGKMKFIKAIMSDELIVKKRNRADVLIDMKKLDIDPVHLNTTHSDETSEKLAELQKKIDEINSSIDYYTNITSDELWIKDIELFVSEYKKKYPLDRERS